MKLALINPNANGSTTEMMVAIAQSVAHFAVIDGLTAAQGPMMIQSAAALAGSADEVHKFAPMLGAYDGVIVSAFGDPGVDALRAALAVPVIGIGAASATLAARGGQPFGVATTTLGLASSIDALMRSNCADAPYLGCFVADLDAEALMAAPDQLDAALLSQIGFATQAGARRVIIGGGPLGMAAERLKTRTTADLINPIKAAVLELIGNLQIGETAR